MYTQVPSWPSYPWILHPQIQPTSDHKHKYYMYQEKAHISGPTWFKPTLFKRQLYFEKAGGILILFTISRWSVLRLSGFILSKPPSERLPLAKIHEWLANTESTQVSVSFSHPPVRNSSQGIMKASRYSVCLHDLWWEMIVRLMGTPCRLCKQGQLWPGNWEKQLSSNSHHQCGGFTNTLEKVKLYAAIIFSSLPQSPLKSSHTLLPHSTLTAYTDAVMLFLVLNYIQNWF